MREINIKDPFVITVMRNNNIPEIDSIANNIKLEKQLQSIIYKYYIYDIQYLLLKDTLINKLSPDFSSDIEIIKYCSRIKNEPQYINRYNERYKKAGPFTISISDNKSEEVNIILDKINDEYTNSQGVMSLTKKELTDYLNPVYLKNYYECVENTLKYFQLKDIGIDNYIESREEKIKRVL